MHHGGEARLVGCQSNVMSNTEKDKPSKFKFPEYFKDRNKTKKPKEKDTEWHWMSTPSWWTRIMMNRPQRRKGKLWEATVKLEKTLDEVDPPEVSKKPHKYYW
jgi:hypothetical protein